MFSQTVLDNLRGIRAGIPPVNLESPHTLRANLLFVAQVMKATEGLLWEAYKHVPQIDEFSSQYATF